MLCIVGRWQFYIPRKKHETIFVFIVQRSLHSCAGSNILVVLNDAACINEEILSRAGICLELPGSRLILETSRRLLATLSASQGHREHTPGNPP